MALARYTFLPWLRRGAASAITSPASGSRASIKIALALSDGASTGATIPKSFSLIGPGDVTGIHPDLIIRTEPKSWVTDFEPNYLVFAEFYDEDFCWRHTPAPADSASHRLTPWINLLVLAEGEFESASLPGRPLPSVTITAPEPARFFPPANQAWAWAHVQIAAELGAAAAPDPARLAETLARSPDRGLCRLVSPRRLEPNRAYHAFIVPTFEVGRKAGLGLPVDDATEPGTAIAWAGPANEYPVYHQWYFRTGEGGDFEDLVQRIEARPVDKRVGVRDLDISRPGFGMPSVADPVGPDHHRGLVGLEGALHAPTMESRPPDPASMFADEVAAFVNAPADAQEAEADDPVVAPPLTGGWHVLVNRVDPQAPNGWTNALNLDPRHRAAGGLGGRVVRANQERYMNLAWEQVGEIIAANRRIAGLRFAMLASEKLFARHLAPLSAARLLPLTAAVFARVLGSPTTLRGLLTASRLPNAATSAAFRKLARPRGLVARRALPPDARPSLAGRIALAANDGRVSAAPTPPPVAGPTIEGIAAGIKPDASASWLLRHGGWILGVLLAALVLALMLARGAVLVVAIIVLGGSIAYAAWSLSRARRARAAVRKIDLAALTPDDMAAAPPADFAPSAPGSAARPQPDPEAARRFAEAQQAFVPLFAARPAPPPPRPPFDADLAHRKVKAALRPADAYPRRAAHAIKVGDLALTDYLPGSQATGSDPAGPPQIAPVMAYPDLRDAMYAPLAAISDELLVPNLGLIPPNSISLMLTNPPFIEAYMAGLNHEFARELLWREYPTDSRGSPFRQFWEVAMRPTPGLEGRMRAAALKDIKPLHEWAIPTPLGSHGNVPATSADGRVVLVLRGDLLKRYPNTLIYAQRARWSGDQRHRDELALYDEVGEQALAGVQDPNIAYPSFSATLAPDLNFVGFDLGLEEVRGDPALAESAAARTSIAADKLGWFFVLQEVPGEPRLGLDETPPPPAMRSDYVWDNFSWADLDMGSSATIDLALPLLGTPEGNMPPDKVLNWRAGAGATAADIAAILNQKPVMVAWHARQMLERGKVDEV